MHNGREYLAAWWTQGQAPNPANTSGAWQEVGSLVTVRGKGVPTWTRSMTFDTGDLVYWGDQVWEAQWWSRGQSPDKSDQWGPWLPLAH
jgi:chitodextrinase